MIQYFGWRDLFWGQLVLLVIAAAVVALHPALPAGGPTCGPDVEPAVGTEGAGASGTGMDWVGSWSLAGSGDGGHARAEHRARSWGGPRSASIGSGPAAVALGGCVHLAGTTFATPLIPTKYWRRRNFMFPMGMRGFSNFAYFGGFFLFPLLMEQVYGYSVSQVGFVSVARPLVFALSAPIAGYMTVRTGRALRPLPAGASSVLVSMVLFATLRPSPGSASFWSPWPCRASAWEWRCRPPRPPWPTRWRRAEYGVMSAAQLMATQVGEVAGIQVVLTLQESIARHAGLRIVHAARRCCTAFRWRSGWPDSWRRWAWSARASCAPSRAGPNPPGRSRPLMRRSDRRHKNT